MKPVMQKGTGRDAGRALQIAEEQMRLAADSLGKQDSRNLNEQASQIFAAVTEGKYQRLDMVKNFRYLSGRHPAAFRQNV